MAAAKATNGPTTYAFRCFRKRNFHVMTGCEPGCFFLSARGIPITPDPARCRVRAANPPLWKHQRRLAKTRSRITHPRNVHPIAHRPSIKLTLTHPLPSLLISPHARRTQKTPLPVERSQLNKLTLVEYYFNRTYPAGRGAMDQAKKLRPPLNKALSGPVSWH